jgi:hypothetical protein
MDKIIWMGKVWGSTIRIRRFTVDDCIVEELGSTNEWEACDDEMSSAAYMAALLDRIDNPTR